MNVRRAAIALTLSCPLLTSVASATPAIPSKGFKSALVRSYPGRRWFEEFVTKTQMSPDGRSLLRTSIEGRQELSRTSDGASQSVRLASGLQSVDRAVFCGPTLLRLGVRGRAHGWFRGERADVHGIKMPVDVNPVCTADGRSVAFYPSTPSNITGSETISYLSDGKQSNVRIAGPLMGAAYSPDGSNLFVLFRQADGASSLARIDTARASATTLVRNLDAPPYPLQFPGVGIAVSQNGREVILPLVSALPPDDEARQNADVKRWLELYAFDVASRTLRQIDASPHDESDPMVAGSHTYFVRTVIEKAIVAFAPSGERFHTVLQDAMLPSYARDGKRLAFDFGDTRQADYALDIRGEAVTIDANALAVSTPSIVVASNHEHFTPEWSPNMKWIAYHSHRAPQPAPYYDALGTSDDIWIRDANDASAPERRMTNFGLEVGTVYWSPDGRKLVYDSLDRANPGLYHTWVTTLDPDTGNVVRHDRLALPGVVSPVWAKWSPDGRSIAIEDMRTPDKQALWIATPDGRHARRVIDYPSGTYGGVEWSLDGSRLLYSASVRGRMQIFSVATSGGAATQLTHDSLNILHPSISKDGRWIAATRVEVVQELRRGD